jgi:hypothetical protein
MTITIVVAALIIRIAGAGMIPGAINTTATVIGGMIAIVAGCGSTLAFDRSGS